jgi:CheY-like chemotaxis protein
VFDLFAQASQGLERSRGGLGLALVKRLVELRGGVIEAHSQGLGHGSTFTVTFPAAQVQSRDPAAAKATAELRERLRVLLVEDNADAREMLHHLLVQRGQDVEDAADGMIGLAKALESPPDVMVVDIGLPKLDGYQLARQVRHSLQQPPYLIAMGATASRATASARSTPASTCSWSSRSTSTISSAPWRAASGARWPRPTRLQVPVHAHRRRDGDR